MPNVRTAPECDEGRMPSALQAADEPCESSSPFPGLQGAFWPVLTLIIPRGSPQQCARGSFTGLGRVRTGKSRAGRVPCERCPETFLVSRQIFCFYLFIKYLLGNYSTPNTELTNWLGGEEGRGKCNGATLALGRTPRAAFTVQWAEYARCMPGLGMQRRAAQYLH